MSIKTEYISPIRSELKNVVVRIINGDARYMSTIEKSKRTWRDVAIDGLPVMKYLHPEPTHVERRPYCPEFKKHKYTHTNIISKEDEWTIEEEEAADCINFKSKINDTMERIYCNATWIDLYLIKKYGWGPPYPVYFGKYNTHLPNKWTLYLSSPWIDI